ncbi:MAG: hypothetical protein HC822_12220 [Oscillochloris sp.]|nr:hypothetical protein [Oscillochloris sp.]
MRDQITPTLSDLFAADERLALVLADISRSQLDPIFQRYPLRAVNVGIMEQTMIGVAAGLALEGFIPVAHSIAAFLVERPFEQLKIDFCYQQLGGNFIGVGGSHDYSMSGMTHHTPGDILALRSLPGMQIVVPGTAAEFDLLFRAAYANNSPTYYRLSVRTNQASRPVRFGELIQVRAGKEATIVAVGPMLDQVLAATADLDVAILYCTTVAPFDRAGLRALMSGDTLITVEPGYAGALLHDVMETFPDRSLRVRALGLEQRILHQYGTVEQLDAALGLSETTIRQAVESQHLAAASTAERL